MIDVTGGVDGELLTRCCTCWFEKTADFKRQVTDKTKMNTRHRHSSSVHMRKSFSRGWTKEWRLSIFTTSSLTPPFSKGVSFHPEQENSPGMWDEKREPNGFSSFSCVSIVVYPLAVLSLLVSRWQKILSCEISVCAYCIHVESRWSKIQDNTLRPTSGASSSVSSDCCGQVVFC